jgi:hypothetical protein
MKAMLVSVLLAIANPAMAQDCWVPGTLCSPEERALERQRDIEHQHNLDMRQMELQNRD